MQIAAINGSPRGEKGNTFIMIEEFLKGARNEGAKTEHILLADKKIHHCIGCFTCWFKTPGKCVFKDDMSELINKIDSDVFVFGTPLYVDNVTGLMKNFMDRLIPKALPFFEKDKDGESIHKIENYKPPKFVVISNCGFPEQSHFQVLHLLFQRIARNFHTEVIAEIYRGEGELLGNKHILLLPILMKYKRLLRRAGEEIVTNLKLSYDLKARLDAPLVSHERYSNEANKYFEKKLDELGKT